MNELENAIAELSVDSPNEEIDEFVICSAKTKAELEAAISAEDAEELTPEEADEEIAAILMEHSEKLMDIFDLEVAEMSAPQDTYVASFSQGLSQVLAGAIAEEYENPEDGIADLVEATGAEATLIDKILAGEAVPNAVMGEQIASVLKSLSEENAATEWSELVNNAYNEALEDTKLSPSLEAETEEGSNLHSDEAAVATMAARQSQILAEFDRMKTQTQLAEELRVLEAQATGMVEEGILTPFEKQELLGSFGEKEDTIALFSQVCEATNTPPQVQLDRTKFYLHMRQRVGQTAMFGELSDGDRVSAPELSDRDKAMVDETLNDFIG